MQIEKYIADKITSLCEKRDISKYRLSQLSGISQSSLGRIMVQENLPSLITLEKICIALGVTLSQFFQEGNSENLTEKQKEVLGIWNDLSTNEQETVMSMPVSYTHLDVYKRQVISWSMSIRTPIRHSLN